MWEICRIGAQVRPEIVLCIRFVKKAPSAAIDDRPMGSSNRKEEVLIIAIEKKDRTFQASVATLKVYVGHLQRLRYNPSVCNI
ncbi:hypothetical protein ALC60_01644 [Trachymyrmex zeteki]|uniref:Uncharacterized protein n=1 Tax=Mycetomoellerius zeteki TaxID=64791 RepID=A0A151XG27_9HYME|nr:hypothetical protein ALC60_01644 [Trachymyrmex zeteki]